MNELLLTIFTYVIFCILVYTPSTRTIEQVVELEIKPIKPIHDPDTFLHYSDLMSSTIRELKAHAAAAKLPRYGRFTKSELQLALL